MTGETLPRRNELTPIDSIMKDILAKLSAPFEESLVKQRIAWKDKQTGRAHHVDYIEWGAIANRLDAVYPGWSHHVKEVKEVNGRVIVTVALTINGVTREGAGTKETDQEYICPIKTAESDALKRAAAKFGVARYLYCEDREEPTPEKKEKKEPHAPEEKAASDGKGRLTNQQLAAIFSLAKRSGMTTKALQARTLEAYQKTPQFLSYDEAAALIQELQAD